MSKKGQGEIIGLALIVLILLIGFILYISLRGKGGITSSVENIQYNNLASLELSAILNTYVDECGFSVAILVKQCLKGKPCSNYEGDVCELLKNYLEKIFEKSFDKWGRRYRLYVKDNEGKINYPEEEKRRCNINEDTLGVATQAIPLSPGTAELRLEICG